MSHLLVAGQATLCEQCLGGGWPAAKSLIGRRRITPTAGRIDGLVEPAGGFGVEDVTGCLESPEGVRIHHLGPQIAVVAGRVAADDVLEMRNAMAHDDLLGHADARERLSLEVIDLESLAVL